MTQTYRTDDSARSGGTGQGFNLFAAQVDINFWDLIQRMIAQEARPDPSAGIAYFEINGTMMYVHMTDGTVLGPYELPVATFLDRGVRAPLTAYNEDEHLHHQRRAVRCGVRSYQRSHLRPRRQ